MSTVIDGKALAARMRAEIKERLRRLRRSAAGKSDLPSYWWERILLRRSMCAIRSKRARRWGSNPIRIICPQTPRRIRSVSWWTNLPRRKTYTAYSFSCRFPPYRRTRGASPHPDEEGCRWVLCRKCGESCHESRNNSRLHSLWRHENVGGVRNRPEGQERGRARAFEYCRKTDGDASSQC